MYSSEHLEISANHSVISTVKLHGMSCWRYLGEFFKKIFNGCREFFSLTPANIGMAYAKYRANENESKFTWLLSSAADIHKITVKSNV